MGVGRGRFRKALRAVLLSQHATPDLEKQVRLELPWECTYCGLSGENERLQLDHLWPEGQGGCPVIGNVVPACPTCNSDRGDIPWAQFMQKSSRVRRSRTEAEIKKVVARVTRYMKKHGQASAPSLDKMLTRREMTLLGDFDLLLAAISDGALATAGYEKKASVVFGSPAKMFDSMVALARKHKLKMK